jgi:hypothetical protein
MKKSYIVDVELYEGGISMFGWGNLPVDIIGNVSAHEFMEKVNEHAQKFFGVDRKQIRIVGVYKL